MSRMTEAWGVLIVAGGLLLLAGCTGSDALKSGNSRVQVLMEPTANNTHWSEWVIQVTGTSVRPADPAALVALGPFDLSLLGTSAVTVDFNNDFDQVSDTSLPAGTYTLETISMRDLFMFSDSLGSNPQVCEDFIVGALETSFSPATLSFTQFGGTGQFTVSDDMGGRFSLRIDADAFRDAVYAVIDCGNCQPAGCDTQVPFDPSCRCFQIGTSFLSSDFRNLSSTFLSVN